MEKKLFKNCPYADLNISCEYCCQYGYCQNQKQKLHVMRIKKRRIKQRIVFLIVISIIFTLILKFCSIAKGAPVEPATQETTQESIQESTQESTQETVEETTQEAIIKLVETEKTDEKDNLVPVITSTEIAPTLSAEGPGQMYYYQLSLEDKILIAKVVYAESRGEIFEGKVAVAAVVLNRFRSNDPVFKNDTIDSLVHQRGQFASINNITEKMLDQCPSCMEAVEAACKGWDPTREVFDDGAKYFYAPAGISGNEMARREGILTMNIGNHAFHNDFAKL